VLIEGTGARVPWDRLVVFEIDSRGALHPITSVRIERPDQEPREVTVPITSAGAADGLFPARSVTIPHATP
jgi:hypothetical protein